MVFHAASGRLRAAGKENRSPLLQNYLCISYLFEIVEFIHFAIWTLRGLTIKAMYAQHFQIENYIQKNKILPEPSLPHPMPHLFNPIIFVGISNPRTALGSRLPPSRFHRPICHRPCCCSQVHFSRGNSCVV